MGKRWSGGCGKKWFVRRARAVSCDQVLSVPLCCPRTPRDLSPIEVVKIQQQVAVQMIWSSMAKAMIDKSEMPGAASALCQGSGLEGLENNITIIIVIVSIVNISTIIFVIMLLPWHHGHVCVICIFGFEDFLVPCCQ